MGDATTARLMMIVRFRSRLTDDELQSRYRARMSQFRQLPGLVQKYYIRDEATGEWGGVYLWDSEESAQQYLASDLRKTIASTYEVEGTPRLETLKVVDVLRT